MQCFKNGIKPFFEYHNKIIKFDTLVTKRMGHAFEFGQKLSSDSKYDSIVCVGGDGTLSEFLNGLYQNKNITNAMDIGITQIPCGSGNCIVREIKSKKMLDACTKFIDGKYTAIDAYIASQKNESKMLGFVSTQWGIIYYFDIFLYFIYI